MSQQLGENAVNFLCEGCGHSGRTSVNQENPDACKYYIYGIVLCCIGCICCGCFVCASACADGTDRTVHRCPKCDKFIGCAGDNMPRTNSTLQSPTSRSNNNEIRSDCNQISPQQNKTIAPSQTIVIVPPNSHSADDNPPSYFEATSQPQFDLD